MALLPVGDRPTPILVEDRRRLKRLRDEARGVAVDNGFLEMAEPIIEKIEEAISGIDAELLKREKRVI